MESWAKRSDPGRDWAGRGGRRGKEGEGRMAEQKRERKGEEESAWRGRETEVLGAGGEASRH